jgi:hypothetical protein
VTPAEAQAIVVQAGQQAEFRMKEYQRHGATLESVHKRIASVQAMRDVVAKSGADEAKLLNAFDEVTREEVGFWMEVYLRAAPAMMKARDAADAAFADLAKAQDVVSEALRIQVEKVRGEGKGV